MRDHRKNPSNTRSQRTRGSPIASPINQVKRDDAADDVRHVEAPCDESGSTELPDEFAEDDFGGIETATERESDSIETLPELEREIGISDWIDPQTGEPAEGQSPPHLNEE